MRRLLVTGGAGFIGSNFVNHWLKFHPGERVVVLDALTYAGNRASLAAAARCAEFRFVEGNITDQVLVQQLLLEERIDTLVHFAAESHVDRSILGPDAFIETNVLGTHSLLKAAKFAWLDSESVGAHRFHHVSTDEVYGSLGVDDPPFAETTAYAPNSPYAASKAASDHLVRAYHHTFGLNVTTSNCSNNYGPNHFPEKLIPLIIVNLLTGKPLPIYGDGHNVRDWLHVTDHCRAIDLVVERGGAGEVYNVGGRAECENIVLVRQLCAIAQEAFSRSPHLAGRFPRSPMAMGRPATDLISFVPDRPGHDRRYAIDCSKIERELGFAGRVPLQQGLRDTFEWFVANEAWWQAVMSGDYRRWVAQQYESKPSAAPPGATS